MKINISILLLLFALLASCNKQAVPKLPASYIDYLNEKQVLGITASANDVWVLSSTVCDTCNVPVYVSSVPLNYQLTKIAGNTYSVDERTPVWKPVRDRNNNLYAKGKNHKDIYKINGINDYSLVVETGDLMVNDFVFDHDNHLWIWGTNGIGYWDDSSLKVYNQSNSILPTNIMHGIAVDANNIIWIPLDYSGKGILKIDNGNWSIVPISSIPGVNNEYLANPVADNDGNIWFNTAALATSKIVKYNGSTWTTVSSNNNAYIIGKDQKGNIWQTVNNTDSQNPSSLYSLKDNEWQLVSAPGNKGYIFHVDVTDNNTFIGTSRGLVVK